MNTDQKVALKRLVGITKGGLDKYPLLGYLVTCHNPVLRDVLYGWRKTTFLAYSIIFIVGVLILCPIVWLLFNPSFITSISIFTVCVISYLPIYPSIVCVEDMFRKRSMIYLFLDDLKLFEDRLGYIVSKPSNQQSITVWSNDTDPIGDLRKVSDYILIEKASKVVSLEDLFKAFLSYSRSMYCHHPLSMIQWRINEERGEFKILHEKMNSYNLAEEKWDRFFKVAKEEIDRDRTTC